MTFSYQQRIKQRPFLSGDLPVYTPIIRLVGTTPDCIADAPATTSINCRKENKSCIQGSCKTTSGRRQCPNPARTHLPREQARLSNFGSCMHVVLGALQATKVDNWKSITCVGACKLLHEHARIPASQFHQRPIA